MQAMKHASKGIYPGFETQPLHGQDYGRAFFIRTLCQVLVGLELRIKCMTIC